MGSMHHRPFPPASQAARCSASVISSPSTGLAMMSGSADSRAFWVDSSASVKRLPSFLWVCATRR